jgi:hypothetical protein
MNLRAIPVTTLGFITLISGAALADPRQDVLVPPPDGRGRKVLVRIQFQRPVRLKPGTTDDAAAIWRGTHACDARKSRSHRTIDRQHFGGRHGLLVHTGEKVHRLSRQRPSLAADPRRLRDCAFQQAGDRQQGHHRARHARQLQPDDQRQRESLQGHAREVTCEARSDRARRRSGPWSLRSVLAGIARRRDRRSVWI